MSFMSIDKKILETFENPVIWCQSYLRDPRDREKPLLLRSYQKEVLQNSRSYQNIILQWGRRMGKSVAMCADCLWWASVYPVLRMIENKDVKTKPFTILIFTPYESQIKELWNTFIQLIGDSPLLKDQVKKIRCSDIHSIEFKGQGDNPGSIIKGYTVGISSSNQGTSLRGLSGDMIFIDEMDFIPTDIIEQVIMPITTTHPDCKRRICSTPSGARDLYFKWCFPEYTKVNTPTKLVEIKDININDYVIGKNGIAEKVTKLYKQPFEGDLISIKTSIGSFSCTPNHELLILGKDFIPAETVKSNDFICIPKRKFNKFLPLINYDDFLNDIEINRIKILNESKIIGKTKAAEKYFGSKIMRRQILKYEKDEIKFGKIWSFDARIRKNIIKAQDFINTIPEKDLNSLFRLFGYYLAEGSILKFKKNNKYFYAGIQFSFNEKETEYITEVCNIVKNTINPTSIKLVKNRKDHSVSILIYGSWISYIFKTLFGEYSGEKFIFEGLLGYGFNDQLLNTYLKGDGYTQTTGKFACITKSENLANIIVDICISLSIPVGKSVTKKGYFTIYELKRKSFYKIKDDCIYYKIKHISKKFHNDFVYNIETENTHTYNVNFMCVHNCTQAAQLGWFHTHYPSWHPDNDNWMSIEQAKEKGIPIYNSTEFQVKSVTSSDNYIREYGAEFGEEYGGVYKHHLINKCLVKYGRNIDVSDPNVFDPGFTQNPEHKYIIGVDWNSYINGGQIVVLEFCTTPTYVSYFDDDLKIEVIINFTGKYRLFYRKSIKSKDATQRLTRLEIIRLLTYYKIDFLYVDYGAGDTNIEELSLYGRQHPELNLNQKLRVIDSGATVEHYDHVIQKMVKKRNKSLMINFSVLSLEEEMFILPKEEDYNTKLIGQMRNYVVKHVTTRGEYAYEGEDHILDAFNLAVYGFQQNFGQLLTSRTSYSISLIPSPRIDMFPRRESTVQCPIKLTTFKNNGTYNTPIIDPEKTTPFQRPRRGFLPGINSRQNINSPNGHSRRGF